MNQISFCAKIPIATCQVKNKITQKYEPATVFEYTCDSNEDIIAIEKACDEGFDYAYCVLSYAHGIKKCNYPAKIYFMESQNGNNIAICATQEDEQEIKVKYLESKIPEEELSKEKDNQDLNKYRYCGSTMLAMLAKLALYSNSHALKISKAVQKAEDFYTKTCSFKSDESTREECVDMVMRREKLPEFIRQIEERTKGKINIFI